MDDPTTGLNGYKDKIVLIDMKRQGKIRQWKLWKEREEVTMILKALRAVKGIDNYDETIIGYNC